MSLNLSVNILGDYSKLTKAVGGAQKKLTGFERSSARMSKNVASSFRKLAAGFGAYKIGQFLVSSAKAAGEDQRAQALLATTMKRVATAKQTDIASTEKLIGQLEAMSGVADDFLRPAMSKLVSTTKNTSKAQNLLKTAINASAKSGKPLQKVVDAISKAYQGNTKSLEKMFPELVGSKNALGDLGEEVRGQAAKNADPFAKVQVGIQNIQEIIGAPLIKKVSEFMDQLFAPENAKPLEDAGKAIAGIAQGFDSFFSAFDSKGDAAKGFLNVVKGIADTVATSMEVAAFWINTLRGKPIDIKLYPHLVAEGIDIGNFFNDKRGNKKGTKSKYGFVDPKSSNPNQLFNVQPKVPLGGSTGPNITYRNTYNITTQTTDKLTAQTVVRMIQNYEKTSGKKYFVSSSVA